MAAAQVVTQAAPAIESYATRDVAEKADVRLAVHDTSRIEWAVSVPLPRPGKSGNAEYAIELDLEVPAHVLAAHSPWDHLQEFTRLDGPDDASPSVETIDALRRFAVGIAAKLARTHEGFSRHARLVASPFATDDVSHHVAALEAWVTAAEHVLVEARRRLRDVPTKLEIEREARLVDEYLSLRMLELLAGAERALCGLQERTEHSTDDGSSKRLKGAAPALAGIEEQIADALAREMERREDERYIEATADSPGHVGGLERYLDRASQLKKHFQEVLFLESERFTVSDRFHHVVAGAVALVASTWAFVGQLYLTKGSLSASVSGSLIMLCIAAGIVYAVKDRIKEVGRQWFASNVHRFYAQRIARYRAPAKTCPSRDVIVRAKESFLRENGHRADPLNPTSGATVPVTTLRYRHHGTLECSQTLTRAGISRVKHVFRYDMSPLFARLDDATKSVPVFDSKMRRVRFTQAPRCYRVPIRIVVRLGRDIVSDQQGALVLHKRGLERIDFE
jgi:hypothetical protein